MSYGSAGQNAGEMCAMTYVYILRSVVEEISQITVGKGLC